jgi:pectin methylesterase-like acyl-CoA thioesterase
MAGPLAVALALMAFWLVGGEARVIAASSNRVITVAPTGGDDTQRLQAALDEASTAGRGAVIELAAGTFHVGRP